MLKPVAVALLAALSWALTALTAAPASAQVETIVATDDFNRADELPLAVTGNWGRTIAGNYDGFSNLTGSRVTAGSNEGIYYWKGAGAFSPTSQFARHTVLDSTGEPGIVLMGGPDHAILLNWGPPGPGANKSVFIYWYANGQDQGVLAVEPSPLADGDVLEGVLDGGVIYAKVNGVVVKSLLNTTTLTTGTPGFITYANPALPTLIAALDDWEAGTPLSYSLGGTILEDGLPRSGVLVTASGGYAGSATTGIDGTYAISGVPGNTTGIVLTPTLAGHTMTPVTRTVAGPVTGDVGGQDFTSAAATTAVLTTFGVHGSVTRDPDLSPYPIDSLVTLTPVPDPGYAFAGWTGDVPPGDESDDPLVVTMDQDRTITATFGSPNLVAADDFNRANEIPVVVGGNWQKSLVGGSADLAGNQITGATGDALYYWQGPGIFDNAKQFARARVTQAAGQVGLVLLGATGQGIVASWSGGTLFVYWYSGGTYRGNLTTAPSTLANGDLIEAELSSGIITVRRNGTTVASAPNTTTLTTGTPGFETFQLGAALDDWEAGTPITYAISGTITEASAGLSGVLVTASGGFSGTTTTNSSGAYSLAGVPLGATGVVLTPTLAGHLMSPVTRTVAGPVTSDVTGEDFTSTPATTATLTTFATHGSITRDPDLPIYPIGTPVTLTPVADPGYVFLGWSGSVPPGHQFDDPLVVTMDQDRTITAAFGSTSSSASDDFNRPNEVPLVVGGNWQAALPGGTASLLANHVVGSSADAVYYWQGLGTFENPRQFARARVVDTAGQLGLVLLGASGQALIASWDEGVLYVYWYSGGIYRGNLTTTPSVIQNGDLIEAELFNGTVSAKVNGSVVLSVPNTTTLTSGKPGFETFQTGGILDDWEAGTPLSYSISGTVTDGATGLSGVLVTATGGHSGGATTDSNGAYTIAGIAPNAGTITLTPALAGYLFTPVTRAVTGPVTGNATDQDFTGAPATTAVLTTSASHGSVLRDPDADPYPIGTPVTLTPVPDFGYAFASWAGDVPPGQQTANPLVVTMDQDRTISALFVDPSVSASESFDRANETPLAVGGNWLQPFTTGVANLAGNRVAGGTGEAIYYWQGSGTFSDTSQFARARIVNPNGQLGLVLLGGPGQAIVAAWDDGTLYVYWYSSGIYRGNLETTPSTVQAGDVVEAELTNGRIRVKINGLAILSVMNTTTLTSGRPGFETFQSGGELDDWQGGISTTTPIPVFPYAATHASR